MNEEKVKNELAMCFPDNFEDVVPYYDQVTKTGQKILHAVYDMTMEGQKITNKSLSEATGISVHAVSRERQNPAYISAQSYLTHHFLKAKTPEWLQGVEEQKDYKFLLKYTNEYVATQKILVESPIGRTGKSDIDAIKEMVIILGKKGIDPSAYANLYIQLKNEGAW